MHASISPSAPEPLAPSAPPAEGQWVQAPYALLRVASLPACSVQALATPHSSARVHTYLQLEGQLEANRTRLSDLLSRQVRRVVHDPGRLQATIRLRRALYGGKAPRPQDWRAALPAMPARLRRLVQRALSKRALMRAAAQQFASGLQRERAQVTRALIQLLRAQPHFLAAFDTVNAPLVDALLPYLNQAPGDARDWRRLELTLVSYLMRASVKTSPLSRLAWNVPMNLPQTAETPAAPEQLHGLHVDVESLTSTVVLHNGVTRRLFWAAALHPALKEKWAYAVNPDLQQGGRGLRALIRERGERVYDRQIALDSPKIGQLLGRLGGVGALPYDELLATVASGVKGADAASVRRLVDQLIGRQLLVLADSPRDDLEPLEHLSRALLKLDQPQAQTLISILEQIGGELRQYAESDVERRSACQLRLHALIAEFFARCEVARPELPRRLLYENAGAGSLSGWTPQLGAQERRALATLATLFDARITERLLKSAAFVGRYHAGGTCGDLSEFLLPPQETGLPEQDGARWPDDRRARAQIDLKITRIQEARRALIDDLLQRAQQGDGQIGLQRLEQLRAQFQLAWSARSISVFLQRGEDGGCVLNGFASGHGMLLLRHLRTWNEVGGLGRRVAEHVAHLWPEGVVAQLVMNSESTVNGVPRVLAHTVAMPGTPPTVGDDELRLRDLRLVHDPHSDELQFYTAQGQRVIPLYLGTLAPTFLAPLDRAVAEHSPSLAYQSALLTELERRAGPRHGPRRWPRLSLGSVVVARESWILDPPDLPQRQKSDDDFTYWCNVRRWLREQQLPSRFFAHSFEAWRARATNADQSQEPFAKPHYFDLDHYHFVRMFERWARELRGTWCVQEVYPDTLSPVRVGGHRHVAELCCELSLKGELT